MKFDIYKRGVVIVLTAIAITSCAQLDKAVKDTMGVDLNSESWQGDSGDACNAGLVAATATITCAALTHKQGSKKLEIAAACGLVSYIGCQLANSYTSKQTKSGSDAIAEYKQHSGRKDLPPQATLTAFSTTVSPDARVVRGNAISFSSSISAIPGEREQNVRVEHEVAVLDSAGDRWGNPVRKIASENTTRGGSFESSFSLKLKPEMEEGQYRLEQSVYINGRLEKSAHTPFQVLASSRNSVQNNLALVKSN